MRDALGESLAIVPSTKKVGGFGARLDVPIGHRNAAYVRGHFDAMEVGLPDGRARTRSCSRWSWRPARGSTPAWAG